MSAKPSSRSSDARAYLKRSTRNSRDTTIYAIFQRAIMADDWCARRLSLRNDPGTHASLSPQSFLRDSREPARHRAENSQASRPALGRQRQRCPRPRPSFPSPLCRDRPPQPAKNRRCTARYNRHARSEDHRAPAAGCPLQGAYKVLVEDETGDVLLVFFLAITHQSERSCRWRNHCWISGKLEVFGTDTQMVHHEQCARQRRLCGMAPRQPGSRSTQGALSKVARKGDRCGAGQNPRLAGVA